MNKRSLWSVHVCLPLGSPALGTGKQDFQGAGDNLCTVALLVRPKGVGLCEKRVTDPSGLARVCATKHTSLRGRAPERPVSKGFVQNPCRETGPCQKSLMDLVSGQTAQMRGPMNETVQRLQGQDSLQYVHISLVLGSPALATVRLPPRGRGLRLLGVVPKGSVMSPERHCDARDINPFEAWGSPEGHSVVLARGGQPSAGGGTKDPHPAGSLPRAQRGSAGRGRRQGPGHRSCPAAPQPLSCPC